LLTYDTHTHTQASERGRSSRWRSDSRACPRRPTA
jgi:hypothetical protein